MFLIQTSQVFLNLIVGFLEDYFVQFTYNILDDEAEQKLLLLLN